MLIVVYRIIIIVPAGKWVSFMKSICCIYSANSGKRCYYEILSRNMPRKSHFARFFVKMTESSHLLAEKKKNSKFNQ